MRTLLTSLFLIGVASAPSSDAAHIVVTAMGVTYDIECSEITVDGSYSGGHWLTGNAVCSQVCSEVDALDGWSCEFVNGVMNIDGPLDTDFYTLLRSDELDLDFSDLNKPQRSTTRAASSR